MLRVLVASFCASIVTAAPVFAQDGAALYTQRCASCHDGGQVARAPSRDVIAALTPDRIVGALETGTMRVQGETLTADQRRAIAAYLSRAAGQTTGAAAPVDSPRCAATSPLLTTAADWRSWGVTTANDRFQRVPGFSSTQAPNLKLKWAFGFDGENAAASNPTIVGDRVFVGSGSGRVYALGLKGGCVHWTYKADGTVRAAVVVSDTRSGSTAAYFGDTRAFVYSVDATTGALRWKKQVDPHRAARVTGSPVLYEGRLYVPVSSVEEAVGAQPTYECCTFRGSIVALDANTGDELWRTYTITEAPSPRSKNAKGTQLWGPSGGAVWSAPTVDAVTRSLYVATGDAYSMPAAPMTDAIVALDLATGAIKWAQQTTEGDVFTMACGTADTTNCPEKEGPDHDFGQSPILVTLADGKRVIVAGQKSGVVHGFDPDQRGKKLWSTTVGRGGVLGGVEWGSASDGQNMYVPLSDLAFKEASQRGRAGLNPEVGGGLFALRIADGQQVWLSRPNACADKPSCSPALSAPAAAIPGAVFGGSLDGHFRAFATTDGRVLWDFDTVRDFETVNGVKARGGSIDVGGAAIANGTVVTTSGYGQWGGMRGNVLLAFSVDGK
jgi:polyvinyl alcohol dehydrogenase (cytochrome)